MMNIVKKIALLSCCCFFTSCANILNEAMGKPIQGDADTVHWKYNPKNSELTLSGTMTDNCSLSRSLTNYVPACSVFKLDTEPCTILGIGSNTFNDFTNIKEFTIPATCTYIASGAFDSWSDKQKISVDWDSTDRTISRILTGLKKHDYTYKDGVVEHKQNNVENITSFSAYYITQQGDDLLLIDGGGDIYIPVSYTDNNNVSIPCSWDNDHSYSNYQFINRYNITTIQFNSRITGISSDTLINIFPNLKTIYIPRSVTYISDNVFRNMNNNIEIILNWNPNYDHHAGDLSALRASGAHVHYIDGSDF